MRIVHVSDCYPPRVGGIENQVHDLAAQQSLRGSAVHVLTATAAEQGNPSRYRASTTDLPAVRVHRMATPVTFGIPIHPRGYWLIRRALTKLAPDVVHVHAGMVAPFAWDGAQAARSLGLPLVVTWHSMLDGAESLMRIGARFTGWDRADFVASAVSSVAAERVAAALGRTDVHVLPNGLDLQPWLAAADRPVPRRAGPLRVIATQRLAARKRARPLIESVQQAHRQLGMEAGSPRLRLTLVGGGAERERLKAQVSRRGLGDVVALTGPVPRPVLPTLYRDQDVFAAPATLEAFGIAALEARAAALVVVGREGTGMADFITDDVDGYLTSTDAGLTEALVRLAREPHTLSRLRRHSAEHPPAFGWDEVVRQAGELYTRARL
ncbi:MAG: glycosyltransferase [Beutenbergiaceae bacterium]